MNRKSVLFCLGFGLLVASSCSAPKDIAYFQDLSEGVTDTVAVSHIIRIMPGDKLSIAVTTRDPQLSSLFNLTYVSRNIGYGAGSQTGVSQMGMLGYMVDAEGAIDFPVLGHVKVSGLTRCEISDLVKDLLIKGDHIKDPVVTVDYMNLNVSVLGSVANPGRVKIDRDEFTIYDAISSCGDLSIEGKRQNVKVVRTTDGVRTTYVVDLTNSNSVLNSPVYYLQQNDILYVEPNDKQARQSTVNGNTFNSVSFWMQLTTLLMTVISFIAAF